MSEIYECEDEGCCLNCSNSEEGCLCYECQCTKCEHYNSSGYCEIAEEWRQENYTQMAKNIQVSFSSDKWLRVKLLGPVVKGDYAKARPFLQLHLQYNDEEKCYRYLDPNPRFIPWLLRTLEDAGFEPQLVGLGAFEKLEDVSA